ncbi:MAG: hypothetical protein WC475_04295 [Candidatus Paceibacterota bacterium]
MAKKGLLDELNDTNKRIFMSVFGESYAQMSNLYRNLRNNKSQMVLVERITRTVRNDGEHGKEYFISPVHTTEKGRFEAGVIVKPYLSIAEPSSSSVSLKISLKSMTKLDFCIPPFLEKDDIYKEFAFKREDIIVPFGEFLEQFKGNRPHNEFGLASGTYADSLIYVGNKAVEDCIEKKCGKAMREFVCEYMRDLLYDKK